MTTLQRASRDDIPKRYRWQLSAAWDLENERAKAWLRDQAAANLGREKATFESAMQAGSSLPEEILHTFVDDEMNYDPQLMLKAERGDLQREAASPTTLYTLFFATWTVMLIETFIFFWLWLKTDAGGLTVVMGIALAGGSYLAGRSAGLLMAARDRGESIAKPLHWVGLVGGLLVVIGLAWSRSPSGDSESAVVWVVTGALALAIIALEALHCELSERYKDRHSKEFTCQQWFAQRKHKSVYTSGFWKSHYDGSLRSLSPEMARVFGEEDA